MARSVTSRWSSRSRREYSTNRRATPCAAGCTNPARKTAWRWPHLARRAWSSTAPRLTSPQPATRMSSGRLTLLLILALSAVTAGAASAPAALKDGLLVATPVDVALHEAPLETLTADVIARDYPDTTSVLLFKDERL